MKSFSFTLSAALLLCQLVRCTTDGLGNAISERVYPGFEAWLTDTPDVLGFHRHGTWAKAGEGGPKGFTALRHIHTVSQLAALFETMPFGDSSTLPVAFDIVGERVKKEEETLIKNVKAKLAIHTMARIGNINAGVGVEFTPLLESAAFQDERNPMRGHTGRWKLTTSVPRGRIINDPYFIAQRLFPILHDFTNHPELERPGGMLQPHYNCADFAIQSVQALTMGEQWKPLHSNTWFYHFIRVWNKLVHRSASRYKIWQHQRRQRRLSRTHVRLD